MHTEIIDYVVNHWADICACVLAVQTVATAIVNVTHTPDPTTPWGRIYAGIEVVAGLVSNRAKDRGGDAR